MFLFGLDEKMVTIEFQFWSCWSICDVYDAAFLCSLALVTKRGLIPNFTVLFVVPIFQVWAAGLITYDVCLFPHLLIC